MTKADALAVVDTQRVTQRTRAKRSRFVLPIMSGSSCDYQKSCVAWGSERAVLLREAMALERLIICAEFNFGCS
jgi:hypothetical protein